MASIAAERLAVPSPVVTTPPKPGWMSNDWTVTLTNLSGVSKQDTVRLRTDGTLALKASHSNQWVTWGTSCMLSCAGLSGVTMDNKPFLITFNSANRQIQCSIPPHAGPTQFQHKPGPDGTWTAEEGGAGMPGDSQSSGPSHG